MAITILDLAEHRGAKPEESGAFTGGEIHRVGLPMMGGCQGCGATIAAYNAYPSKTGYLRCKDCVGELGYATCEEADAAIFGEGSKD
jgi:hypothetical protein